jgi:Ca2+-binding RTX toxin-like protein
LGTPGRDVIVGRKGKDIIDGRGGNDLICGGPGADRLVGKGGRDRLYGNGGSDRLFGGLGPDRLFGGANNDVLAGQVGSDTLGGGPGIDTCYQNQGSGPVVSCELPLPPPPAPNILAIAYADLDGSHSFTGGDVMISQLVDANGDGRPSNGDIVEMGRYPTRLRPGTGDFAGWQSTRHAVLSVDRANGQSIDVSTTAGGRHAWMRRLDPHLDAYEEYQGDAPSTYSGLFDNPDTPTKLVTVVDEISASVDSPSRPGVGIPFTQSKGTGDDRFIDVEIYP